MTKRSKQTKKNQRTPNTRKNNQRQLYYGLAVIFSIVLFVVIALVRQMTAPVLAEMIVPGNLSQPANTDGKAWGPVDAPILIEEYADFQCPYCGQFATGPGQQLIEAYADTGLVRFEYNHFAFIGAESTMAAEAAECANEQDQFWAYHDMIFANQNGENQGTFVTQALKNFGTALDLDQNQFEQCIDDGTYRSVVRADASEARARGVTSTPTLFINGEIYAGGLPFEQIQAIIEQAVQ